MTQLQMVQQLERRCLFAVTAAEQYPGFWVVDGDDNSNFISVNVYPDNNGGGFFTVTVQTPDGGETTAMYSADDPGNSGVLTTVALAGHGGDDTLNLWGQNNVDAAQVGGSVDGGDGSDTITLTNLDGRVDCGGGDNVVTVTDSYRVEVRGGDGNDYVTVSGNTGPDGYFNTGNGNNLFDLTSIDAGAVVYGGTGNDTIKGSAYGDAIYADAGNDLVLAGAGNDVIYDTGGQDYLDGGDGDDTFWCQDGVRDYVYGGAGNNAAHVDPGGRQNRNTFDILDNIQVLF
jgi:Ca2+-binding RTX toxin-like protein